MSSHPFGEHIGMRVETPGDGRSRSTLTVAPHHLNPHGVVHGAVLCALADTGMGAALYTVLAPGQSCATIELKISFLAPARGGELRCETELLRKGRAVAFLESRVYAGEDLAATASGSYALFGRA
jgi:acyl-CoA thioesterase